MSLAPDPHFWTNPAHGPRMGPKSWAKDLKRLRLVDWRRSNTELWEGRAMVHGRISKARSNILLTGNVIKTTLGLELTAEEQALEDKLT